MESPKRGNAPDLKGNLMPFVAEFANARVTVRAVNREQATQKAANMQPQYGMLFRVY